MSPDMEGLTLIQDMWLHSTPSTGEIHHWVYMEEHHITRIFFWWPFVALSAGSGLTQAQSSGSVKWRTWCSGLQGSQHSGMSSAKLCIDGWRKKSFYWSPQESVRYLKLEMHVKALLGLRSEAPCKTDPLRQTRSLFSNRQNQVNTVWH